MNKKLEYLKDGAIDIVIYVLLSPLLLIFFIYDLWDRRSPLHRDRADELYQQVQKMNTENEELRRSVYDLRKLVTMLEQK